jgi:prepilin-type N-terminal cleavage/methylation domain-containing protein
MERGLWRNQHQARACRLRRTILTESGFTLIEMMVVVLIIGILVGIAVPVFFSVEKDSEKTACQSNLRTIESMTVQYLAEHGNWPDDIGLLVPTYLPRYPVCLGGGTYSLDDNTPPRAVCSAGHTY